MRIESLLLWKHGNGCGVSTMETILLEALSSTSLTNMKYVKMRKLFLVPLYALFVIWSPLHEGKKQNTQLQRVGLNLRKKIKG